MNFIEVSFSPLLYKSKLIRENFITVIVDILRASTSICAALGHGVNSVIPVEGIEAAMDYKKKGYLVACERDGKILDFADMGNSPSDFLKDEYRDRNIVFSTTNGTKAVKLAEDALEIVVGSFINLSTLSDWLVQKDKNIVIFCAGWKNLFNLEDSVYAGALADKLISGGKFMTECDSTKASIDLWNSARNNLQSYLSGSSHRNRLKHLVSEKDFIYTITLDSVSAVPLLINGSFKNAIEIAR